jgi:transcriptional regulator with XRE-family HTH domain
MQYPLLRNVSFCYSGRMDMDIDAVRRRIEELIEARGTTARALSIAIGRNEAYIQQFVSGLRNKKVPGPHVMQAIADELRVSRAYLETGSDTGPVSDAPSVQEVNDEILDALVAEWRSQLGESVDRLREIREVENPDTFRRVLREIAAAMATNADKITKVAALLKNYRGED